MRFVVPARIELFEPLGCSVSWWPWFLCKLFSLFPHDHVRIAAGFFGPCFLCSLFSLFPRDHGIIGAGFLFRWFVCAPWMFLSLGGSCFLCKLFSLFSHDHGKTAAGFFGSLFSLLIVLAVFLVIME